MFSYFQIGYLVLAFSNTLEKISDYLIDTTTKVYWSGAFLRFVLLILSITTSFTNLLNRKYTAKEVFYIFLMIFLHLFEFARRYYEIYIGLPLYFLSPTDIFFKAILVFVWDLKLNNKNVPGLYNSVFYMYLITTTLYFIYEIHKNQLPFTFTLLFFEFIGNLLEYIESVFVIDLKLSNWFFVMNNLIHFLLNLLCSVKIQVINMPIKKDFIRVFISIVCNAMIYFLLNIPMNFVKYQELRLAIFGTFFPIFLDVIFKIIYIFFQFENSYLKINYFIDFLVYTLFSIFYLLCFLFESILNLIYKGHIIALPFNLQICSLQEEEINEENTI